jgi:hypothetical protein
MVLRVRHGQRGPQWPTQATSSFADALPSSADGNVSLAGYRARFSITPRKTETRDATPPRPPKRQENEGALSILLAPSRLGGLSLWCSRIVTAD